MGGLPKETVVLRAAKSCAAIPLLRLVIGGVAARGDVRVDQLDDLQLAVETLVVEEQSYVGDLTLEIALEARGLVLRLDGLCNQEVRALLHSTETRRPPGGTGIDMRMLLDALVDRYAVVEESDDRFAVRMEKWAL